MEVPEDPNAVQVEQCSKIIALGPRAVLANKGANRTVLKVGMSWSDPHRFVGRAPEAPSARDEPRPVWKCYQKRGFPGQARNDSAICEKPHSVFVGKGAQGGVGLGKAVHLTFIGRAE